MKISIKLSIAGLIVWIGLGFLMHILFLGTAIDWSSALSWFVILLWPAYIVFKLFIIFLYAAAIVAIIAVTYLVGEWLYTNYLKSWIEKE